MHPNARLIEAFNQAQGRFYAGDDDTATLRGLLADDIAWHVPGRSAIAGDYRGHEQATSWPPAQAASSPTATAPAERSRYRTERAGKPSTLAAPFEALWQFAAAARNK